MRICRPLSSRFLSTGCSDKFHIVKFQLIPIRESHDVFIQQCYVRPRVPAGLDIDHDSLAVLMLRDDCPAGQDFLAKLKSRHVGPLLTYSYSLILDKKRISQHRYPPTSTERSFAAAGPLRAARCTAVLSATAEAMVWRSSVSVPGDYREQVSEFLELPRRAWHPSLPFRSVASLDRSK